MPKNVTDVENMTEEQCEKLCKACFINLTSERQIEVLMLLIADSDNAEEVLARLEED